MSSKQVASAAAVPAEHDAYGQEIWNCYKNISIYEIVERADGLIDIGSALPYFQGYENWLIHERESCLRS